MEYWQKRNSLYDSTLYKSEKQLANEYKRLFQKTKSDLVELYYDISTGAAAGISDLYRYDRFYDYLNDINVELRRIGENELEINESYLKQLYIENSSLIGQELAFKPIITDADAIRAINTVWCADGKAWSDRIWANKARLEERLKDGLVDCVSRGASKDEAVKQLMKDCNIGFNQADRLIRTELSHIQNQSTLDTYVQAGIEEYEWIDTSDKRCCDACGNLNGKRFPITDTQHIPPNFTHPNCRCTILAVLK